MGGLLPRCRDHSAGDTDDVDNDGHQETWVEYKATQDRDTSTMNQVIKNRRAYALTETQDNNDIRASSAAQVTIAGTHGDVRQEGEGEIAEGGSGTGNAVGKGNEFVSPIGRPGVNIDNQDDNDITSVTSAEPVTIGTHGDATRKGEGRIAEEGNFTRNAGGKENEVSSPDNNVETCGENDRTSATQVTSGGTQGDVTQEGDGGIALGGSGTGNLGGKENVFASHGANVDIKHIHGDQVTIEGDQINVAGHQIKIDNQINIGGSQFCASGDQNFGSVSSGLPLST